MENITTARQLAHLLGCDRYDAMVYSGYTTDDSVAVTRTDYLDVSLELSFDPSDPTVILGSTVLTEESGDSETITEGLVWDEADYDNEDDLAAAIYAAIDDDIKAMR